MKSFFIHWMPVIALAGAIFVQSHYPSPESMPRFPFADKLLHGVVYGVLAALCYRALRQASPVANRGGLFLFYAAVVMATLFGASDEWHQSFIAARDADLFDLLADFSGSCAGAAAYARFIDYFKAGV